MTRRLRSTNENESLFFTGAQCATCYRYRRTFTRSAFKLRDSCVTTTGPVQHSSGVSEVILVEH